MLLTFLSLLLRVELCADWGLFSGLASVCPPTETLSSLKFDCIWLSTLAQVFVFLVDQVFIGSIFALSGNVSIFPTFETKPRFWFWPWSMLECQLQWLAAQLYLSLVLVSFSSELSSLSTVLVVLLS